MKHPLLSAPLVLLLAIAGASQCPRFTGLTQNISEFVTSTGGTTSTNVVFTAHYSGAEAQTASITSSASSNTNVANGSGETLSLAGGTGAAQVTFQLEYPIYVYDFGRCLSGQGTSSGSVWVSANYWDPAAAPDLFRSPASDPSWSIGSYSGSGSGNFGTPVLFLDNDVGGGIYRADYPLQWTDQSHGQTYLCDTRGQSDVAVYNPDVGSWWATNGSDEHLIIADTVQREYWDFYHLGASNGVSAPAGTPACNAPLQGAEQVGMITSKTLDADGNKGGADVNNYNGSAGGTTATQITGFAGAILPGELDCSTCINHALAVSVPYDMNGCNGPNDGYCNGLSFTNPFNSDVEECNEGPQTSGDSATVRMGPGTRVIFCEGAKVFLPASFTPQAGTPTAVLAIINALKLYGGIIVDQGGPSGQASLGFYTAGYYDSDYPPGGEPPSVMPPASLHYEGISSSALAPYMVQIGQNLMIAYTCTSGCS